jgi:sentrin-specific protease 1
VDIFKKDVVLIPINLGNMHWTAGVINVKQKRFEYYDSMGDASNLRRKIFAVRCVVYFLLTSPRRKRLYSSSRLICSICANTSTLNTRIRKDHLLQSLLSGQTCSILYGHCHSPCLQLIIIQDLPQQNNGSDCGVFSMQTLENIARGRDTKTQGLEFTAEDMVFFRQLMVYEIATGSLVKRW